MDNIKEVFDIMLPTIINSEFEITNMFQQKTSCDEYLAQLNQKENIQSKIYAMNNSISDKKGKQINKIKELLINPQYKKIMKWFTNTIFTLSVLVVIYVTMCIYSSTIAGIGGRIFATIIALIVVCILCAILPSLQRLNLYLLLGLSYLFFYHSKVNIIQNMKSR